MSVYEKMQFLGRTHDFVEGARVLNTFHSEEVKYTAVDNLPSSIDWRNNNVVTPVKNQGSCGKDIQIFQSHFVFISTCAHVLLRCMLGIRCC